MICGISELLRRVREENLVEGLAERELENPEGAGFDFRIGELFAVRGGSFLGEVERETPAMELLARYEPGTQHVATLTPHTYYVMKTVERVNTPPDLMILFRPRSTLYRSGILLLTGNCSPGYRGELHFGIMNLRDEPFQLEMGARVCHAMFFKVEGETALYRGQWQGGRATTKGKERQV